VFCPVEVKDHIRLFNIDHLVQNSYYLIKNGEKGTYKKALAARRAKFFEMAFCFCVAKPPNKHMQLSILSSQALPEKYCGFSQN
jgi:hypothetical protein